MAWILPWVGKYPSAGLFLQAQRFSPGIELDHPITFRMHQGTAGRTDKLLTYQKRLCDSSGRRLKHVLKVQTERP